MSVGLALIARDEAQTLPCLLRSIEGAFDQVVMLDTGSEDRTVDVFERWASRQDLALGYKVEHFEWRDDFAAARNAADAMLDTDWLSWGDCDDEVIHADRLRDVLRGTPDKVTHVKIAYETPRPHEPDRFRWRYRLYRRGIGRWIGRIHEEKFVANPFRMEVPREFCSWRHSRQGWRKSSAARNRRIARAWVEEEPENARALYLAAREELIFGHSELGYGAWSNDADYERGMDYATRFLRLVAERDLLGPYGLRVAEKALRGFTPGADPRFNAGCFNIALEDPAEWPGWVPSET